MNITKLTVINNILAVEGGYVNDTSDSGGETNYGITKKAAMLNGYFGAIIDMPRQVAFDILAVKYWDKLRGDDLELLSSEIAAEIVDTGVNMGTRRAGIFLQRALNILNSSHSLYNDLYVDGQIGDMTVNALASYLNVRDVNILLKILNCMQGAFYIELAERREKDEKFIYGWFKNRVG